MLRKFRIKINEKEYMVEMEELGTAPGPGPIAAPSASVAAPAPSAPAPSAPAPVAPSGEGLTMEAPMPGNILDVQVKVGDAVSENQVLVILEAMKMENEIVAPKTGTVTAVYVTKGSAIDVGAPIVTIA
ncbi:biotin/lipoyl-containing protein [Proteiniclasticum sp.]|uniref:biotin/lipoyl-containing protein n=1 Tax=Proteiniclasticum sp. TaxID=2053595 RepID=UPI00289DC746|nr:biotin/lipoyl-containing protein [Proteiniclasticum sp.]